MGALELLLSTPLSVRDILRGQLMALRRQFLRPLLAIILIELVLARIVRQHSRTGDDRMVLTWMAGILILVADVVALIWVALSSALSSKNANQAIIKTLVRVLILPWVMFAIIAVLASLWAGVTRKPGPGWRFHLGLWFWLGLGTDFIFGLSAWVRLRTGFRELALRVSRGRTGS